MKSPPAVTTPRNMKQLCNLRYKHLNQTRISRDALYNKHELAYDIPGFIRKITTYPDLVCICGLQEILEEANKVLQLKSPSQLLSYDTTFKLGDFYVSPLLFKRFVCNYTRNSTWNYLYDQPKMRKHLYKSFQMKTMTLFPLKKERQNKERKVKTEEEILVYCHCRMPELPNTCRVQCSHCENWFHIDSCVSVPPEALQPKNNWCSNSCTWTYCLPLCSLTSPLQY